MSRLHGFSDLVGLRVGVYGLGVEGRAALEQLKRLGIETVAVDDNDLGDGILLASDGGLEELHHCDVVLKSPGIPRRREDILALEDSGVLVTSPLALWLSGRDRAHVIGVTGTKGKSTTSSLIDFFLRALGVSSRLTGNIGQPPFDPLIEDADWTVVEISSFQAVDVTDAPGIVVVTSLGSDHLDWHGSLEQYHRDKLQLTHGQGHHLTIIPDDPELLIRRDEIGGDVVVSHEPDPELASALGLVGEHNARNVGLALRVVSLALHRSPAECREHIVDAAASFTPLPGRLTLVHRTQTPAPIDFIDDGLATNPLATSAALEAFTGRPVALIVGGFDRGMDYAPLAAAIRRHGDVRVTTTPAAGKRIGEVVRRDAPGVIVSDFDSLNEAVDAAVMSLGDGGVVVLSPGAPSFGQFHNWKDRSDHFTNYVRSL